MSEAQRARRRLGGAATESARRCRLSIELAAYVQRPIEPFAHGSGAEHACELYRQAAYWALEARARDASGEATEPPAASSGLEPDAACGALLEALEAAGWLASPDSRLSPEVAACRCYADFAQLPSDTARGAARALKEISKVLLDHTDAPFASRRLWRRRLIRIGATLAAAGALVGGVVYGIDRYHLSHDLAAGKPWRISSSANLGCKSPERTCEGGKDFFFHTRNQSEPWLEIDFGEETAFSSLYIVNRKDCCTARAIPMIVEVWEGSSWRQVARRNDKFDTWRPSFDAVHASKVRLRVARWTMLHLQDVRVLP